MKWSIIGSTCLMHWWCSLDAASRPPHAATPTWMRRSGTRWQGWRWMTPTASSGATTSSSCAISATRARPGFWPASGTAGGRSQWSTSSCSSPLSSSMSSDVLHTGMPEGSTTTRPLERPGWPKLGQAGSSFRAGVGFTCFPLQWKHQVYNDLLAFVHLEVIRLTPLRGQDSSLNNMFLIDLSEIWVKGMNQED